MSRVKDIRLKVIPAKIANNFVRKYHYSGKVTPNSSLHFGCFLGGVLHGVLSFGPGIDKRKTIGLVAGTRWNEYIELNRMAFDNTMPKNSASRVISIAIKLLKRNAPCIKWLLSYADATKSGDGAIYRASGFVLTKIEKNKSMYLLPDGNVVCKLVFEASFGSNGNGSVKRKYGKTGKYSSWTADKYLRHIGGALAEGFQLRYIYFLHPEERKNLTVPKIPFSKIDEMGAGMYKGRKKCDTGVNSSMTSFQDVGGGAVPTVSL